jgi:hypothetical protein
MRRLICGGDSLSGRVCHEFPLVLSGSGVFGDSDASSLLSRCVLGVPTLIGGRG